MPFAAPNSSGRLAVFVASIVFSCGCSSIPAKDSVHPSVEGASTIRVCDAEKYRDNPGFQESSKKSNVHKIKDEGSVYIQDDIKKCETVFDEDYGIECGVQRNLRLIWQSRSQVVDSFSFLDSGCEEPGSHILSAEPWAPDSIQIQNELVKVRHYWNYYVRTEAEEKNRCMVRILKIDRKKMKLVDLGWDKCH